MTDGPVRDRVDWRGRRIGRPLTPRRQALMAGLLPRLRVGLPGQRLDPFALFPARPREVWLEIGFGSGEHLAEQAQRHPDVGVIGCEVFVNGVAALLDQIDRRGLANVRIFDDDARLLLPALPEACLARAFLLFPDPWPKTRHAKRRFVGAGNLALLARLLADGAEFRIATDDAGYVRWVLQQMAGFPDFAWRANGPADWRDPPAGWLETRYQRKAQAAARRPVFLCFERRPRRREA
jgi:tRNA (guanine-N7-)-methyltransferase